MTELYQCDRCGKTMSYVSMEVTDQTNRKKGQLCANCANLFRSRIETWMPWGGA